MAFWYLLVALVAAAVAVFALQNSAATSVRFLAWTLDGLPVAAVALGSLAAGLVVAGVPLWLRSWRWRSRAGAAETRVAALERALAERDRAVPQRPPPPERPSP
jgi:uncharacterized integral membrane protein